MDPTDADDEKLSDNTERDPRLYAIPDTHGHAKGEHKAFADERPLPLTARMLFLWFYHACRRGYPRFLMVADHMNYLTFEDPAAVNLVRRALKLAQAGDLYGAAETANVEVPHAAVVSDGLRRGMHYSIGAEVDNDPRSRPDAQNIVDAMRPDAIIRSVHFISVTHPVHGENWHWPFDNPEFKDVFDIVGVDQTWELYVTALVDAIERLPGHIIGHFFVPAVFGHWPDDAKLDEYENRVLDAAAVRGMAIEFNTRYLYRDHSDEEKARYLEANKRLLRKAKDRGVAIAVGSDAHSPRDQGGAFETVLAVLDELEINEIVFPLGGSLRRVALRVVREPEPEPAPAPPEPPPPPVAETPPAEDAAAAKPVRKARPRPKATRSAETSPERPAERPEVSAGQAEPPPEPAATREPQAGAEAAAPASPAAPEPPAPTEPEPAPAAALQPVAASAPTPVEPAAPAAVKAVPALAAPKPAGKRAAQPAAAKPAAPKTPAPTAPAPKPAAMRPAPEPAPKPAPAPKAVAKPQPPAKTVAKPRPPAKAQSAAKARPAAKPAPKTAAKKAAPAKAAAKKAAPAKAASARKPAAKKALPAKKSAPKAAATKKAAPAKKAAAKKATAVKKPAPARGSAARKASAGKKTTKKTATKRR